MLATRHLIRQSAYRGFGLVRSANGRTTNTAFRSLATTPRSAKTLNPDVNDDNILPVGFEILLCYDLVDEYAFP
jgi:hypothetical protein